MVTNAVTHRGETQTEISIPLNSKQQPNGELNQMKETQQG